MKPKTDISTTAEKSSVSLYREACRLLPGGVSRNTIHRRPHPHYAAGASGCHVTDIEGKRCLDFANNMASLIHGHAHPALLETAFEQLRRGTAFSMGTEAEIDFARLLCGRVPGFERIRFTNSGTEAVMTMLKAARAYTGKSKIAKVEGAYHGSYDYAEVSQTAGPENWGSANAPNSVPVAVGTPQSVLDDVVVIPFNAAEEVVAIFDRHGGEIAGVLIDPLPHRVGLIPAQDTFIETVHRWTRENGALLLFDEVITFRNEQGGMQELYRVQPDMTALGKVIGGGFPAGAVAGSSEVMKVMDPRYPAMRLPHSGTFSANPVTMTAGRVALELFDREAVVRLNALADRAKRQIGEAIEIAGIVACVTGAGSLFRVHLRAEPPTDYRSAWMDGRAAANLRLLLNLLYDEGILMINTCTAALSTVMTEREIDRLSEAMLSAMRKLRSSKEALL